jgi:hypothetical protein
VKIFLFAEEEREWRREREGLMTANQEFVDEVQTVLALFHPDFSLNFSSLTACKFAFPLSFF